MGLVIDLLSGLATKDTRSRLSGDDVYVMGCVAQRHVFSP
ncbi:hypothetical protein VCHA36P161_250032 [Vibrio chagasii]|nr:hypothetical protein VCHA36P161_250032 [Vibrio chagasii]